MPSLTSRLRPVLRRALTRNDTPAVTDQELSRALGVYVGMVDRVLARPERWLGADENRSSPSGRGGRVLATVRSRIVGQVNPTSTSWDQLPVKKRVRWWVRRISLGGGTAAATPRVAGLLADRVPVQGALGAAAAGLAVCAVAREHRVTEPASWIPLLARVVFDRDLAHTDPQSVPASTTSAATLDEPVDDPRPAPQAGRVQRAGRTLWHLAQVFLELGDLFDRRPRGGLIPRLVGKFPVVGFAGGWLDERGGIRKAARQTDRLLTTRR